MTSAPSCNAKTPWEDSLAPCSLGDFGAPILVNACEPRWTPHFSVAHDLSNLLTHESLAPGRLAAGPALARETGALVSTFAAVPLPSRRGHAGAEIVRLQDAVGGGLIERLDVVAEEIVAVTAVLDRVTLG